MVFRAAPSAPQQKEWLVTRSGGSEACPCFLDDILLSQKREFYKIFHHFINGEWSWITFLQVPGRKGEVQPYASLTIFLVAEIKNGKLWKLKRVRLRGAIDHGVCMQFCAIQWIFKNGSIEVNLLLSNWNLKYWIWGLVHFSCRLWNYFFPVDVSKWKLQQSIWKFSKPLFLIFGTFHSVFRNQWRFLINPFFALFFFLSCISVLSIFFPLPLFHTSDHAWLNPDLCQKSPNINSPSVFLLWLPILI